MDVVEFDPEFYALPRGPNGLPDILIYSRKIVGETQALFRAYIVSSTKPGYWCERYFVEDKDCMDWALVHANEKVRQYVIAQRAANLPPQQEPFKLEPFEDWRSVAVQYGMDLYPGLQAVASNTDDRRLQARLRVALKAPGVHEQVESFKP